MKLRARLEEALYSIPYRFQRQGIRFIDKTRGRALIGDDRGLGKTLQAIAWLKLNPETGPVLVVCPASVKYNWQREFQKHAGIRSVVLNGFYFSDAEMKKRLRVRRKRIRAKKYDWPRQKARALKKAQEEHEESKRIRDKSIKRIMRAKILIVNYHLLQYWLRFFIHKKFKTVIYDECHYVSNPAAKMTKAAAKIAKNCKHVIGLSGTPMKGRPIKLFPILHMIAPTEFPSYWQFGLRFCGPTKKFGRWDFSGSSNLDVLHHKLRKHMIRRMKVDVLKELPPKQRTIIPIEISNREEYEKAEENFLSWLAKKKGRAAARRAASAVAIVKMGQLKQVAAKGKLNIGKQWIRDFLEGTDQKLLVFAYHKAIIRSLMKSFPGSALIDGSVPSQKRQAVVDRFAEDPDCRLFIGQTIAAGEGIDGLKVASTVLFMEIGWEPGEHEQAEDRVHRIGQKNPVNIYYLVGKDTIEEKLLSIVEHKDGNISQALDGKKRGSMRLLHEFLKKVTA